MSKTLKNTFPNFAPFTSAEFDTYQKFIYRFPQHCDFVLNNMLIWLSGSTVMKYSWLNDNLVLRIEEILYDNNPIGDEAWYTIIGDSKADESLKTIFSTNFIKKLLFVPDYFIRSIKNLDAYIITEDLSNRDYVLNIEALVNKTGKVYENFRYQISYFMRTYSENTIIRHVDLSNPVIIKDIVNSMHRWPRITSFESNGNDPNRIDAKAIDKLLQIQPILPIKHQCLALYIDGEMQAFSIYHIPYAKDKIAMGNHIKFNAEYKRVFDFLVYVTALRLKEQGVEILNAEQDMGIEGLRQHKGYLNPFTYYEKFSILPV